MNLKNVTWVGDDDKVGRIFFSFRSHFIEKWRKRKVEMKRRV